MESWNREQLYTEVWEEPVVKVAQRYGVSGVMIGKVCRKLQIPVPGRGYWAKKEFGKPVSRLPLPKVKNLPVMLRYKDAANVSASVEAKQPEPEPNDEHYKSIIEMESRDIPVDIEAWRHKQVAIAAKTLRRAKADSRGILERHWEQPQCLDIRVTKNSLDRALCLANSIVKVLEAEKFPVTVQAGKHSTSALIFGQAVPFAIVEKVHEIGRRQVKEYSWTSTVIDYEGTGTLEFRAGDYVYGKKLRDGKKGALEALVSKCIGALMRDARDRIHRAEQARLREIERQREARQRAELAHKIAEEEKKVKEFEAWVDNWVRARHMRDFIAALEKVWTEENIDLAPDAPRGKRIIWMKQQADRVDPMVDSPPSILDRKREVSYW